MEKVELSIVAVPIIDYAKEARSGITRWNRVFRTGGEGESSTGKNGELRLFFAAATPP